MITKQTKAIGGIALALCMLVTMSIVTAVYVITTQGERLQTQIALLADVAAQERNLYEVKRILTESQSDREALAELFLTESDTIDFLSTIEEIARRQGLALTTESLNVQEPKGEPATLAVSFSFVGRTETVRDFIMLLETLPYGSYLTRLQLQNDPDELLSEAQVTVAMILLPTYD